MEVCSNCGAFVERLNDVTGWCLDCSPNICERCGGHNSSDHKVCISCQREEWLIRNADSIEIYLIQGLNFSAAVEKVRIDNRAVCIMCGSPILGRNKSTTMFCTKTQVCRSAQKKYINLTQRNRLSKDLALEVVLREAI